MDVSILTVTWNSEKFIIKQIESVKDGAPGLLVEQLVADNDSDDDTVAELKKTHPNLFLKVFSSNTGFAYANNRLYDSARGKYVLLLNPDIEVLPDGIKQIFDFAERHPKVAICGGLLLDENGEIKVNALPRKFPTLFDQLVIFLKLHHFFPKLLNQYLNKDFDYTKEQMVDSVQGSFMLIRKEFCEKNGGLFDERYFIWFEDVDLCRAAKQKGFEVWFVPVKVAKDFGGRSFAKQPLLWKQINFASSMIKYFKKWGIKKNSV